MLLVLMITPFTPAIDLAIENFFYHGHGLFLQNEFFSFIYSYAIVPAQLTVAIALFCFAGSYYFPALRKYRAIASVLVFTLAIGSGLIIHLVLKDHWGRPRPRQVVEFGGVQNFRPYYSPDFNTQKEPSKSFSCGHCTMGFYFFSFIALGLYLHNTWFLWSGIILSATLGSLLSLTRMSQGAHFFSDVMISALIMWLTALYVTNLSFRLFGTSSPKKSQ